MCVSVADRRKWTYVEVDLTFPTAPSLLLTSPRRLTSPAADVAGRVAPVTVPPVRSQASHS
jgi:hypothetical protein